MKTTIFKIALSLLVTIGLNISVLAGIFDNLQPVKLATNMQFTEGPAWHPDGYLVFSDINGNVIYKWSEAGGLDTLAYPAGNPNGIVCTKRNDFVVCRQGSRDIAKMTTAGVLTSYVSTYNGKKFNSPNDAELSYMGTIYFTDPDFGANTATRELTYEGLFCIPYNKNTPVLLDSTLVKPNGMTFVNDWRTLYVCESSTNNIYSYSIRNESQIQDITKDKKVFVKVSGTGEVDGMCADVFGNLYVAFGLGGVKIFDKDAMEVATITFPTGEKVHNLCFGGKYNNILFATVENSLYKVELRFFGDFIAPGLLGVPTDKSVIFNALSDKALTAYIAYGTDSLNLSQNTATTNYTAGVPMQVTIDGLSANSKYYYQLSYKLNGSSTFLKGTSGSFYTQRAKGSNFSFAVEADPHLDEGSNYLTFRSTLQNARNLNADFLIDLGDNFMVEKFPIVDSFYMETRSLLYRNFWDHVCNSMPLFIVQGNHDTEMRWLSNNTATDDFNTATRIRKRNYPTPEPNEFYSGNSVLEQFVGYRQNYYAWNWGDALFVVIDPFGYTETKPSTDPWAFTLGKTQYDWFRKTLEESDAKYKFVFAHHLVGGDNLGRGGVEKADFFENGGKDADSTYGFDTKRPGWGKPLHQIMVETGVQIYFHGHDHFYAEQEKDGIIYQEVPQPSFPAYTTANDATTFGYVTGTILPNSGHLNVKIIGDSAQIDYIGGYHVTNPGGGLVNGASRRTYYVKARTVKDTTTTPVDTSKTTSVSSLKNTEISAYQAGNYVFVSSSQSLNTKISLYSITGKCEAIVYNGVVSSGTTVYPLPEKVSSGVYLLNLSGKGINKTIKIIR